MSFIGPRPDLLNIMAVNPPVRLEVEQPVLTGAQMERIRAIADFTDGKFHSKEIDITYPLAWGREAIEARLAAFAPQRSMRSAAASTF